MFDCPFCGGRELKTALRRRDNTVVTACSDCGAVTSSPDTVTQLESLFSAVRAAEANWRLDDRIDLSLKIHGRKLA